MTKLFINSIGNFDKDNKFIVKTKNKHAKTVIHIGIIQIV